MFSIVIPSFNNLGYLKLCVASLKKNSFFKHELIFHINNSSDGSLDFIKSKKYKFTYSHKNTVLCLAVNQASTKASTNYILYSHDDIYFLPSWDQVLKKEINLLNNDLFYLSGVMINEGPIKFNCGSNFKDLDENKLLTNYKNLNFYDFQGSYFAPHVIHKKLWDKVCVFSEEFNPGDASDPDLVMKLWKNCVRIFKGINEFKVYHFGSTTTIKRENMFKNNGNRIFLKKWRITPRFFRKYYLRGFSIFEGFLPELRKNIFYFFDLLVCKLKLFFKLK